MFPSKSQSNNFLVSCAFQSLPLSSVSPMTNCLRILSYQPFIEKHYLSVVACTWGDIIHSLPRRGRAFEQVSGGKGRWLAATKPLSFPLLLESIFLYIQMCLYLVFCGMLIYSYCYTFTKQAVFHPTSVIEQECYFFIVQKIPQELSCYSELKPCLLGTSQRTILIISHISVAFPVGLISVCFCLFFKIQPRRKQTSRLSTLPPRPLECWDCLTSQHTCPHTCPASSPKAPFYPGELSCSLLVFRVSNVARAQVC